MSKIDKALITRQKKRLEKLEQKYIDCRVGGIRHHWLRVQPDWSTNVTGVKPVAYQCAECSTVKRMEIDSKYGLILGKPRYEYPEGFKLKRTKGDGTDRLMSPNAVRAVVATQPVERDIMLP